MGQHWKVPRSPDDFGYDHILKQRLAIPLRDSGWHQARQWPLSEGGMVVKVEGWDMKGQDTLMFSLAVRLSLSLVRTTWIMQVLGG